MCSGHNLCKDKKKSRRQKSEAGKMGRVLLWAVGSLGGFEHERKAVVRRPGWVCNPQPMGPSHPTLAKNPPSLLLGLARLTAWATRPGPSLASMQRAGLWSQQRSQGHVLRFLVSRPEPSSCVLVWPQVPNPLGTDSLRRNAVPSQGSQQGQGEGSSIPYPHHLGTVWLPPERPWELSLQLSCPPGIRTPWGWSCHVAGGQQKDSEARTPLSPC